MANPLRGEGAVPGTDYRLRYDVNGLASAEAQAGVNIAELLSSFENGRVPSFTQLRLLFWAGLLSQTPDMKIEAAGDIAGEVGIGKTGELIGEAMRASFPEEGGTPQGE